MHFNTPQAALRHHVSGAIARGEAVPIVEIHPLATVRPGDRVTILLQNGIGRHGPEYREATGRAVMPAAGALGWVLNLGGRYGRPGVATRENFVRIARAKGVQS